MRPNQGAQQRAERRRMLGQREHALAVALVRPADGEPHLSIVCACGRTVGGNRATDRDAVTLDDLMGLLRTDHGNA